MTTYRKIKTKKLIFTATYNPKYQEGDETDLKLALTLGKMGLFK